MLILDLFFQKRIIYEYELKMFEKEKNVSEMVVCSDILQQIKVSRH